MRHRILPRGTIKNKSRLNEGNEKTGVRFNEPATNLAIRHTMTNSSRKQQHCCCSNNSSAATHGAAAAAAFCMHIYIYIKLTSRLLRRHLNHHRTYFYTGNKLYGANKTKGNWYKDKNAIRDSNLGCTDSDLPTAPLYFLHT